MDRFNQLYEQYSLYKEKACDEDLDFTTDLLQYNITEYYFLKVLKATNLVLRLYETKLKNSEIRNAIANVISHNRAENVKFCLLIDVLRCYDGLGHPTTFTTPEGMALMILLDKIIGKKEIIEYKQLEAVSASTLSLMDQLPYISGCSEQLGSRYSLFLPTILERELPNMEEMYRRIIYNLCKTIAEVDGVMSISEKEWLNEIALLNDDDPNNDIDINCL